MNNLRRWWVGYIIWGLSVCIGLAVIAPSVSIFSWRWVGSVLILSFGASIAETINSDKN